jgi:hypothetical protein
MVSIYGDTPNAQLMDIHFSMAQLYAFADKVLPAFQCLYMAIKVAKHPDAQDLPGISNKVATLTQQMNLMTDDLCTFCALDRTKIQLMLDESLSHQDRDFLDSRTHLDAADSSPEKVLELSLALIFMIGTDHDVIRKCNEARDQLSRPLIGILQSYDAVPADSHMEARLLGEDDGSN